MLALDPCVMSREKASEDRGFLKTNWNLPVLTMLFASLLWRPDLFRVGCR